MSTASGGKSTATVLIGLTAVAGVAMGAYFLVGPLWQNDAETDLRSQDTERVVAALGRMDEEEFASEDNSDLRRQTLAALKQAPLEDVFDRLRSEDLSEDERERMEANMRRLMMDDMRSKIDEYDGAPDDQKEAVLDRHIDEMTAFRDKMRAYREKHRDDPEEQAEQERRMARRRAPSKEQRKEWMEGSNPDRMMRMFRYWGKMRERAQARGIDMGRPGGRD